jgi:foldase protein PrsA
MLHLKRATLRRTWLLVLAAALLAALLAGCGKKESESGFPGAGKGQVIATYNGGEVTEEEFNKYTSFLEITDPQTAMYLQIPQFKEHFVRQFAMYKTFAASASDKQVKDADEDIKLFKEQLENALKNNADLESKLKEVNLTKDEMLRIYRLMAIGNQLPLAKEDELLAAVTEEEIKAEFEKNPSDFNTATVRHILIGTIDPSTYEEKRSAEDALKLANEVKAKLENGGDWNALAKEYSDDGGSKDNGGLYENVAVGAWVEEFKQAANTQEIGKIGDPVQTMYGYHVIKVENRDVMTFDKLPDADKEMLKQAIVDEKMQGYWDEQENKLDIKVTLPAEASESPSESPAETSAESPSPSPSAS